MTKQQAVYSYYEFDVSLKGITPRCWRRFLLRRDATFMDLHNAIQDACGWEHSHLWEFRESGRRGKELVGCPNPYDPPRFSAEKVPLAAHFGRLDKCTYVYDFGDTWEHEVKFRGIVDSHDDFDRQFLAGKRAFPPEDCGGIDGYYRLLEFLKTGVDPYGEDPDFLNEWIDGWEPEAFSLSEVKEEFDRAGKAARV